MKKLFLRQVILVICIMPFMLLVSDSIIGIGMGVLYGCIVCVCVRKYAYVRKFLRQCYIDVLRIESTMTTDNAVR